MKMYSIFSKDTIKLMGGNRGKLASMAGHSFLHSWWDAEERFPDIAKEYRDRSWGAAKKVTLVVENTAELLVLKNKYRSICGVSLVEDAGKTVFAGPTIVCLGLGPVLPYMVETDIQDLRLLL